jgi:hypothetical protein
LFGREAPVQDKITIPVYAAFYRKIKISPKFKVP